MANRLGGALFAIAALVTRAAGADPREQNPALSLDWVAPLECPSRDTVLARAQVLAGRPITSGPNPKADRLSAFVEQVAAGSWRLRLRFMSSSGAKGEERIVVGHSCRELAEAAALYLAMSVDAGLASSQTALPTSPASPPAPTSPQASAPTSPQAPAPASAQAPAPTSPQAPAPAPALAPEPLPARPTPSSDARTNDEGAASPPRDRAVLGARAMMEMGRLPGVAPGIAAHAGWRRDRWQIVVPASFFPTRRTQLDQNRAADLWMATAGLALGYTFFRHPALIPYVKADLALMHASGALALRGSGSTALLGFAMGAEASYSVTTAWSLTLCAEVYALIRQPGFVLDDASVVVHRPSPVGAQLGIGASFQSP